MAGPDLISGLGYRSIQRMLESGKSFADFLQSTSGESIRDLGIKPEMARTISSAKHCSGILLEKKIVS